MNRSLAITALILLLTGGLELHAQETADSAPVSEAPPAPAVFEQPKKYGIERYMAGWERNPFSTPTPPAPPAAVESVFKEMAYTSIYGPVDNPTFTVVDKRTHERFKLTLNEPDKKKGIVLKNFSLGTTRKDATLEVALGTETATLKYASDYARQPAAAPGARPGGIPGAPGIPQVIPRPGMPAGNPGAPRTAGPAGNTRNIPQPASAPTVVGAAPPPATNNPGMNQAGNNMPLSLPGVAGGGGVNVVVPPTTATPTSAPAPTVTIPQPTVPVIGAPVAPGVPQRRRLIN
ncbi:MAG: hypothetical protein JNG86_14235 [Verrucomicrobiaceae bacterium]|nr:hypothetical protein [Verrucomicrobiaceae bacterium]